MSVVKSHKLMSLPDKIVRLHIKASISRTFVIFKEV